VEAVTSAGHQDGLAPPRRRVVLLGASNLTRGLSTAIATASAYWGGPADVLAALGHGRSYGGYSSVLGRALPGIRNCGLWQALAQQPAVPTAALVTDVGNDLLYEAPPEQVAQWVEECVERLQQAGARVAMTMLPLANSVGLSEWRYHYLRSCFFVSCHLSLDELRRRAAVLDAKLRALCAERGVAAVEQRREWYGFDPIHIRARHQPAAWGEILAPWCDEPPPDVPRPTRRHGLYLWLLPPERRWFFGIEQRRLQPAGRLPDGSTVAIY
jgi:hypothetical protein